jgi:hypothetical protein
MTDEKPPLRLSYEPDDYLCTWSVPDGGGGFLELPGNLELRPERPPLGTVYGPVPLVSQEAGSGGVSTSFPQVVEVPVLSGSLANGGSVFLLDASLKYWAPGIGYVSGGAALLGKGNVLFSGQNSGSSPAPDEPAIESVDFQIGGLDSLLGSAPITSVSNPGTHPENPKDKWTATLDLEAAAKWIDGDTELSIGYDGRMRTADAFEYQLAFSPKATFALRSGLSLRQVVDGYVEPLRAIGSIATGKAQDLTYLAVTVEGEGTKRQVFGTGITQIPFRSTTKSVREAASVVRAKPDGISLLELVNQWRTLTLEHHPLIETYGAMLHAQDQHPRSRFLLLIQALEGLYGHEFAGDYANRMEKHVAQRELLLLSVQHTLGREMRRFLSQSLSKTPPTGLDGALKKLIESLPVNVMKRLDDSALVAESRLDPKRPVTTPGALRVVRNNLAHGTRGYDNDALSEVVHILELVVRAHALRVLGCPAHIQARVLDE